MRTVFRHGGRLAHRPAHEVPVGTIPARLRPHLLEPGGPGQPERPRGDRYEFWVYRQIVKRLASGDIAADTSLRHLRFDDELVSAERAAAVLRGLEIPFTARPLEAQLDALCGELDRRWLLLARDLRQDRLRHVRFDPREGTLTARKPRTVREEGDSREGFYASLPQRGIADVFHFVNRHCGFLAALTPLQPRHARKIAGEDSLTAAILARAIGRGDGGMAETCDIPYHVLSETARQHIRLATLREACDRISDFIAALPIFPLYSFDPGLLFGAVDGQKFASAEPTIKARHSRKYFGRGRGVVAYTLLANHVPLNAELIGANEHESHYVFDICYNNGSDIVPDTITGDMHSVNKANFAILNWFGPRFAPRFTSLQAQLPHLYAASEPPRDCPLRPAGLIQPPAGHRGGGKSGTDRGHPEPQGDDPEHPGPEAVRPAARQFPPQGRVRIRPARPRHLHDRLHPRSSAAGGCPQIAEPDRVLSSAARGDRPGRGCEAARRWHRSRRRDREPVRQAHRQRHHRLQFDAAVGAARPVPGERGWPAASPAHPDIARRVAACALHGAVSVPRPASADRPGYHPRGRHSLTGPVTIKNFEGLSVHPQLRTARSEEPPQ